MKKQDIIVFKMKYLKSEIKIEKTLTRLFYPDL